MKLHLGCGKRFLAGYVHVDLEDFDHIEHRASIDSLPFIANNTVSEIYSSHALEYFPPGKLKEVLVEWHRVLRPGGTLRLAVPDFDQLLHVYRPERDLTKILGPLFGEWSVSTPSGAETLFHKTVFTFSTLKGYLSRSGFQEVQRYNPVEWLSAIDPEYDDHSLAFYPHMDRSGVQISLCVVANKPFSS